ncbi:hypothetical protein ILUMI_04741 [Ignelater luminosus]|uniref:Cytochrome P450 n=1 Tax=Ignelater luminosus TaxID=2038154 RepID=A0A8K0DBX9_IGNLU|nr:hypothetical protein ILUMI_04741 [Ignelater luminosus]
MSGSVSSDRPPQYLLQVTTMWIILLLCIIAVLIYFKLIKPLNYWKEKGIPYQKSWPVLGNMIEFIMQKKSLFEVVQDLYITFPNERYNGVHQFTKPVLLIRDLDLIKKITVKDFDHFMDHFPVILEDVDPLMGKNLLALRGQRWRDMRATLSPSFTGNKMRMMYDLLYDCAEQFTKYFQTQCDDVTTVEIKDVFTRFTNDAIASVAFGLKVDSFQDRNNEFYLMGKEATTFSGILASLKFVVINTSPTLTKLFKLQFFSKRTSKFFRSIIKQTIEQRENQVLVRPDMIHLLMEARKGRLHHEEQKETNGDAGFAIVEESDVGKASKYQKPQLSDEDITAQALIFLFGGFDTTATLMSFIAYELAVNSDVQRKLQEEIDEALESNKGKINYDALLRIKYLDMVVSETLRKWPPGFQLDRVCVKEYTIQPEKPTERPVVIEKDQLVLIPVAGIHHDPKYFSNPEKFDPERFNEENKHSIKPSSYMPFGSGPRSCIASRLALLENKIIICHLLAKFDIVPVTKTIIPLKMGVKSFNFIPDGGIWLGLQQRKSAVNY